MKGIKSIIVVLSAVLLVSQPAFPAENHGAHVHGHAKIQIAIDNDKVTLVFESPMDNLIGFEYKPVTDTEKSRLSNMVAALHSPEKQFVFNPEADCRVSSVKLESALLDDGRDEHESHSDLDGEFIFVCNKAPVSLTVNLFDITFNLKELDIEIVSQDKQMATELNAKKRNFKW